MLIIYLCLILVIFDYCNRNPKGHINFLIATLMSRCEIDLQQKHIMIVKMGFTIYLLLKRYILCYCLGNCLKINLYLVCFQMKIISKQ